ncbi:MAG: NGG1p interacting factor NIF3 [Legionellales bacterium]|nr:NGG1p interacting factor NIF3 [Legionellales bacterium]
MLYVLSFLVPETHLESVKNAIFAVGAGTIGHYSHCAWQTLGEGQFLPLTGSHAFIGDVNVLERVPEYKVEMVCDSTHLKEAVAALKQAHPYETPAYYVLKCEDL